MRFVILLAPPATSSHAPCRYSPPHTLALGTPICPNQDAAIILGCLSQRMFHFLRRLHMSWTCNYSWQVQFHHDALLTPLQVIHVPRVSIWCPLDLMTLDASVSQTSIGGAIPIEPSCGGSTLASHESQMCASMMPMGVAI